MSSQFVDMDLDGHKDILVGSFCGVPYLIRGSKDGYAEPELIKDATGQTVLIADFWNYEEEKWDKTDRAQSEGHCTSVAAVDWDDDGDLDLLLGDYYGGRLYLRLNEGTAAEPGFASTNQPVEAGSGPIVIADGLAAPRVVDWNGDGLFDILCGGSKGGVYLFQNNGQKSAPRFAEAEMLIDPIKDASNSFIKKVPAVDGEPTLPGSSYHIDPVDFDGDGDLDLLVGGRSSWLKEKPRTLTEEEQKQISDINQQLEETMKELVALSEQAKSDEERKKLMESEDYQAVINKYQELAQQQSKFDTDPSQSGDFVWLFRRR